MAELAVGAASPVVGLVMKKLASELWKELGLARSVGTDIQKLQSKLSTIQDVLHDAERRSITDEDEALRGWLRKLRDAALDAEDVMEEFETEALRRRKERYGFKTGKVRDLFSSNNPIVFRYKMASKIKEIRERLDDIADQRLKFHLTVGSASTERVVGRETISFVNISQVYGRIDDREEVIDFLISPNNDEDVSVLPIVGLGGVGKTTLAQYVYNDERLNGRFDHKAWVCVSETFDIHRIMRAIIEDATEGSTLQSMRHQLETKLSGKVFLLVLDDVWNDSVAEWEKLKTFLRVGKKCKIITTTRSDRVAEIMRTVTPKKLQGLDEDDCWTLFKQRAFGNETEEQNQRLVEIGKEIVKRCKGLPLAAQALGSLMRFKREEVEWLAIKNDEIWKLPTDEVGILPILKLSYDHLPSHLKRCFTYCSMFPKDYEFEINTLIRLWMAEGLIDTSDTSLPIEDIGKQYFNNLLQRSFFQDVEMDEYNNIIECKMHDLVHDLACLLTKDESWFIEKGKENIPSGCRYLSIVDRDVSSTCLKTICKAKKLRSLVMMHRIDFDMHEFMFNVTKNLTQLHALDLSWSRIKKLSNQISRLKHLRLLDLSGANITILPTSITRLYHLQTLNLSLCERLQELPEDISNLINLRHLNISACQNLSCIPRGLGRLSNLQTLSKFIVAQENGCTIMELQHLNFIQGDLSITGLRHVKDPNEAIQANLKAKTRLESLRLAWNCSSNEEVREPSSTNVAEEVLERLQPHHDLKKLSIHRYMGSKLPNWMSSSLSKLVCLYLWGLTRCDRLLPLGRLPSLKHLHINGMHAIRRIGEEFYGDDDGSAFPSLESLGLKDMPNFEEWDIEPMLAGRKMTIFPRLINLDINSCPKLIVQPCFAEDISLESIRLIKWIAIPNLIKLTLSEVERCDCLPALGQLPSLKQLAVKSMHAVRRIGDEFYGDDGGSAFLSLEKLTFHDMLNLEEWDTEPMIVGRKMAIFPCLTQLIIRKCPKLTVQPCIPCSIEDLTIKDSNEVLLLAGSLAGFFKLKKLRINICGVSSSSSSEWWDRLQCPTGLEELQIWPHDELTCLPEGIMYLPSLHHLSLYSYKNLSLDWDERKQPQPIPFFSALRHLLIEEVNQLTALPEWIGGITSLHKLYIWSCPNLAMLPDGLQQLTALQYLSIENCPQLSKRCKRETGKDWHKIAHIPSINIWPEAADGEESNERCTFAMKFLDRFGFAHCTGHS